MLKWPMIDEIFFKNILPNDHALWSYSSEEDDSKFTAIYVESWVVGSHRNHLTRFKRVELKEGETFDNMFAREEIDNCVYLFHGWPKLQGEED